MKFTTVVCVGLVLAHRNAPFDPPHLAEEITIVEPLDAGYTQGTTLTAGGGEGPLLAKGWRFGRQDFNES